MATACEIRWKLAQRAEKELQVYIAENDTEFSDIARILAQYRSKCEDVILMDLMFAVSKDVENRLWDIHGKLNNLFRKRLKAVREMNRTPVAERKLAKHFLDFVKSSQRFYRSYIQRLASRFGGIRELEVVANRLTLSTLSVDEPSQVSGTLSHAILISCHLTLVRLGDLSRWRETQLVTKDRNWGPAIGYYNLAGLIYPASGASHNQLAVIALADISHLRATYHLYRALAAEEPHPSAKGNLEIEFKKLQEAWSKGESVVDSVEMDSRGPGKALIGWFMRLHAQCYRGVDFLEHEELESEVLSQLAVDLKERSLESTLNKFVLINVAAEYFAGVRLREDADSKEYLQAFSFFQRLNVKTFFTLLQVLLPELERFAGEDTQTKGTKLTSESGRIAAVTRRVLPSLRHYSSWLLSNATILAAQVGDNLLNIQIKELWKIYAGTLTLLASTFPVSELPFIEYLLEEDEDTLGFRPFDNHCSKRRYYSGDLVSRKPKYHDRGIHRHLPNKEMLGRIRDFLTDGMILHSEENVPIRLVDGTAMFVYVEDGMAEEDRYPATLSKTRVECPEITHVDETTLPDAPASISRRASETTSASAIMDLPSKHMVDDLVDSETTDGGNSEEPNDNLVRGFLPGSEYPGTTESPMGAVGNETCYGLISSVTAREHFGDQQIPATVVPRPFPSIVNSPFSLQPGEQTPGSLPGTAQGMTPSHSPENLQTNFPLQQQDDLYIVNSSVSTVPDPTNPNSRLNKVHYNQPQVHAKYPSQTNYTTGRKTSKAFGNDTFGTLGDITFASSNLSMGSTWGDNRQTGRGAINVPTPPNGQGSG